MQIRFFITTDVFVTLKGTFIPDHGYVMISDIGSTAETALLCNTTYYSGGVNSGGDWYKPDGTRVGHAYRPDITGLGRRRRPGVVQLIRANTATHSPAEGMYHCEVEDHTLEIRTVYVGLYSDGGKLVLIINFTCICLFLF